MIEVLFGARVFDGVHLLDDRAVVHDGRIILAVLPADERPRDAPARELGGGILAPGLVDLQVNGGGGVLFNDTPTVEGIRAIGAAHRRFGTTAFLPTVITDRPEVLAAALQAGREAVDNVPGCLGVHVEGPFIDPRRPGAHPPHLIRRMLEPDAEALMAWQTGVLYVTLAPASVDVEQIRRLVDARVVVSVGHADATVEEAATSFAAGARAVTHLFNAMSQLGHRTPGLVGAALTDPSVICGLIADGYHVADAALRVAILAKGPGGIALISDAMPPAAGGPDTFQLGDRIATRRDGRLTLDDGTLAGAGITLLEAVQYVTRRLGVAPADALQMATSTPARLLRSERQHGCLAPGARADMLHLDDQLELRETWLAN